MELENDPELAHFFAFSLDLFAVADQNAFFTRLNPAWERTLGFSLEYLMSKPYYDFVHPDDRDVTIIEKGELASGRAVMNFENRYQAKDGSWKWLSWVAVPQKDGTVYAVARDITQQREEKQQILELLKKLEKTNQQLDHFAFVVSHDLKSPLRAIMNLAEWIMEDLGDQPNTAVEKHIALLKQRVDGMYSMINDLLEYSRVGRTETPTENVDLNELLREITQHLDSPPGFKVVVPAELPHLNARKLEVKHLLQNLIDNAIKYKAKTDGHVRITCKPIDHFWLFEVEDNGIGINPMHHQRIFQLFQRLNPSLGVDGTGVGLALAKRIVELAGGQIWVRSSEGQGASFFFTWPQ